MATYKELMQEKAALEQKLSEARSAEVAQVIAQIRAMMDEYGLTVDDLATRRRRGRPVSANKPASTLPPKYLNPKTGETWSGRGRAPAWLGKNRNRFLIPEEG